MMLAFVYYQKFLIFPTHLPQPAPVRFGAGAADVTYTAVDSRKQTDRWVHTRRAWRILGEKTFPKRELHIKLHRQM